MGREIYIRFDKTIVFPNIERQTEEKWLFALIWSRADVIGLFSNNVVSFSRNVVLSGRLFSHNVVRKSRMLSVRTDYVLSSLNLAVAQMPC